MKSDDVAGRTKVYEAIVRGDDTFEAGIPESLQRAGQGNALARPQCRPAQFQADRSAAKAPRQRSKRPRYRRARSRAGSAAAPATRNDIQAAGIARRSPNGEDNEPRGHQSFQPADPGAGLRPDPDFDREPGKDPVVVLRRDQEAGDHQLPHLQARARRPVLRAHLRADQGLRVLVRQVQAHEVQGHHLREVRRRSDAVAGPARAHGPYRARRAGRAHLVPEVAAEPHRPAARHDAQGPRAHPLLRILRRAGAGPHPAAGPPAPVRGRVPQGAGRVRRRQLHRRDRRRGDPRDAQGARSGEARGRPAARDRRGDHRAQAEEARQAPQARSSRSSSPATSRSG